jgi:hypothetical protein
LESLRAAAICLGTKADIRLIAKRQYWTIVIQSKARARIERIADELLNEALSHSRRQECLKSAHNLIGIVTQRLLAQGFPAIPDDPLEQLEPQIRTDRNEETELLFKNIGKRR